MKEETPETEYLARDHAVGKAVSVCSGLDAILDRLKHRARTPHLPRAAIGRTQGWIITVPSSAEPEKRRERMKVIEVLCFVFGIVVLFGVFQPGSSAEKKPSPNTPSLFSATITVRYNKISLQALAAKEAAIRAAGGKPSLHIDCTEFEDSLLPPGMYSFDVGSLSSIQFPSDSGGVGLMKTQNTVSGTLDELPTTPVPKIPTPKPFSWWGRIKKAIGIGKWVGRAMNQMNTMKPRILTTSRKDGTSGIWRRSITFTFHILSPNGCHCRLFKGYGGVMRLKDSNIELWKSEVSKLMYLTSGIDDLAASRTNEEWLADNIGDTPEDVVAEELSLFPSDG
jgi:hypothetical protein